jgi:NADPH2:quinone reductase
MGMAINYGTASGDVEAFDLQRLHAKSLIVSRPTLRTYIADTVQMRSSARLFFELVRNGTLKLEVARRYALADVRQAHEDLQSRSTTGSAVLIP